MAKNLNNPNSPRDQEGQNQNQSEYQDEQFNEQRADTQVEEEEESGQPNQKGRNSPIPRFDANRNHSVSFRSQPRQYYDKITTKEQFNNYLRYNPDNSMTKSNPFSHGITFSQSKKNTTENFILKQNVIREIKPKYLEDKYRKDSQMQRKIQILDQIDKDFHLDKFPLQSQIMIRNSLREVAKKQKPEMKHIKQHHVSILNQFSKRSKSSISWKGPKRRVNSRQDSSNNNDAQGMIRVGSQESI